MTGMRGGLAIFAALILLSHPPQAMAQVWPPEPPPLPGGAPRILEAAPGAPVISEGLVRRGEVFAAFPVQYAMVGRVQNDIYNFGFGWSEPRILFPAGTVVFHVQMVQQGGLADRRALGPAYWCAAGHRGRTPRAMCWSNDPTTSFGPGRGFMSYVRSDFPIHFPVGGLSGGWVATLPEIALDASAHAELPPMEFVYVLNNPRDCGAYVRAGIRIEGQIHLFSGVSYGCDADRGIIGFPAGDGWLSLSAVDNDSAMLTTSQAPTTYVHPNERSRIF